MFIMHDEGQDHAGNHRLNGRNINRKFQDIMELMRDYQLLFAQPALLFSMNTKGVPLKGKFHYLIIAIF